MSGTDPVPFGRISLTVEVAPTYGPGAMSSFAHRALLSFLIALCVLPAAPANADYRSVVLADGAAPYYRLADAETPIAFDASPRHDDAVADPDGVSFDQPGIVTSNGDGAIYVNGNGGLQRAPSPDPTAYSIDGWFQLDGTPGYQALIARVRADNTWAQLLSIDADGHLRHLVWDGGEQILVGTSTITPGQPFHVAVTASNDGVMRIYFNGVEDAPPLAIGTIGGGDHWVIGRGCDSGWGGFTGTIDDVAFYDDVLTPEQILAHYQAGIAPGPDPTPTPLPTPAEPLGNYVDIVRYDGAAPYYRLADEAGSTAADVSPLGEPATFEPIGVAFGQPGLLTSDPDLAITLDGASGATRGASPDPTAYTLETWFRYGGNPSAQVLVARVRADGTWAQLLGISAEGRLQHWVWDGHELGLTSTSSLVEGETYYAVATAKNGGSMRLFLNGVEAVTKRPIGALGAGDHWIIGRPCESGWGGFRGTLDEVAFYDTVLSPTQIMDHYVAGIAPPGDRPLRALADCSGNGIRNACVPGSLRTTACYTEAMMGTEPPRDGRLLPKNGRVCWEGDPSCDVDADLDDRTCGFAVAWCINSADPRVPACTAANVASAEVKLPRAKSTDPIDVANRARLESAFGSGGFGVSILRGDDVVYPGIANARADACSSPVTLRVPLRTKSGQRKFAVTTASSHGRTDKDALKLVCRTSTCGNGIVEADHETCDDGNRVNGDGCDQGCHTE